MANTKHNSDLTEVVRCKDCIHSELDGDKRVCPYWMGYDMASQGEWVTVRDDDFCSYGDNEEYRRTTMSDYKELIAGLRHYFYDEEIVLNAADAIEQLVKERDDEREAADEWRRKYCEKVRKCMQLQDYIRGLK